MLSNQKLQNSLNEIKEISHMDTALFTAKGKLVAHTEEMPLPEALEQQVVVDFAESLAEKQTYQDYHLYKVMVEGETEYILVCLVKEESFLVCAQMAVCQIRNLVMSFAEQFDRVDQHSIVLIKDVSHIKEEEMEERLSKIAGSLADNLHMEAMIRVRVGYGNVVTQLPEIAESYQEARMALEVGRVFYAKLGIGRLIYQLPMSLCNMFIKEVFGEKIPDILDDEEAMSTINKFFENNLNISETARQLYVHRNTLVYRLERIEKAIGLDIRTFDDAMTFRIAVMVIAHMKDQM